jgi:hypothetical protein
MGVVEVQLSQSVPFQRVLSLVLQTLEESILCVGVQLSIVHKFKILELCLAILLLCDLET